MKSNIFKSYCFNGEKMRFIFRDNLTYPIYSGFQESWANFHFRFTPQKICALLKVCHMIYRKLGLTSKRFSFSAVHVKR